MRWLASVCALLLIDVLVGVNAGAVPTGSGKIVFVSDRGGTPQIYVMNADGSKVMRLTDGTGQWTPGCNVSFPSGLTVSPDGRKIAFSSGCSGTFNIFVMDANGSNIVQLTKLTEPGDRAETPAFSPDVHKIAFGCFVRGDKSPQICVMNADGSNVVRLTDLPSDSDNRSPNFSPDGSKIVFTSGDLSGEHMYTMKADGSALALLIIQLPPGFIAPSFSPDGRKIAFAVMRPSQPGSPGPPVTAQIYTVNADGSSPRRLTNREGLNLSPVFSPDGRKIVFTFTYRMSFHMGFPVSEDEQIYLMNADGSNVIRLTSPPGTSSDPAFVP